jgi:hypothetical protein
MDIELIETGNGGDLVISGNDFKKLMSFENMPYLAMFGGNVEASTPIARLQTEQAFDWWGNSFLLPAEQMNSLTERTLKNTPLNSAGRQTIENAIKEDLKFMQSFAIIVVSATIVSDDVININIRITRPDNLQEREFIYIWDVGLQAFITELQTSLPPVQEQQGLMHTLQRSL